MTGEKIKQKVRIAEIPEDRAGQRLDNYIASQLPGLPRSVVYRVIRKGQVRINGGRAKPHTRLEEGDKVRIPPAQTSSNEPATVPSSVLELVKSSIHYQDPDFLVLNKPSGMAVHGGSGIRWGIIDAVRKLFPDESVELVHRLDRETSGCLLLSRNAKVLRELRKQFQFRSTTKKYFCLTQGKFKEDRQVVDAPLLKTERGGEHITVVSEQGKPSVTEFRLLQHYGHQSFVEAIPHTGRTHQIRAHAVHLGIPIAGDSKYSSERSQAYWSEKGLKRLFLHAHSLEFEYPEGESRQFNINLPDELKAIIDSI